MTREDDGHETASDQARMTDDREARVQALSDLARVGQPADQNAPIVTAAPPTALTGAPHRRPHRTRALLFCGLLLVAVLASGGLALYHFTRAHSTAAPGQLTINLRADGFGCPSALTWSPDGTQLAVMATGGDCAHQQGGGTGILFYNARSGKLLRRVDLTSVIESLRLTSSDEPRWSPDGQWLSIAVIQIPANTADNNPGDNRTGVLLLPANGGQPRLITGPLAYDPKTSDLTAFIAWDTHAGTVAQTVPLPLSPAATYSWTADGAIAPVSASGDPITSPQRNLFSPWQRGTLHTIILLDDKGKPTGATTEVFTASASYWSPDSRYVTYMAPLYARVARDPTASTPAGTRACLAVISVTSWCDAPVVAPLDPAFAAIVARSASVGADDAAGGAYNNIPDAPLAWRPDGKVVATVLPGNGTVLGNQAITISLYPSDAQHPAVTLTLPRTITNDNQDATPLAWSPSGQQFAAADPLGNTVVLWGAGKLPQ